MSYTLRIFTGEALLEDKESVFWLKVLEIPPAADPSVNSLQIAFRTRIKLFYRPAFMQGEANLSVSQLTWQYQNQRLILNNRSPFYVTLSSIGVSRDN